MTSEQAGNDPEDSAVQPEAELEFDRRIARLQQFLLTGGRLLSSVWRVPFLALTRSILTVRMGKTETNL